MLAIAIPFIPLLLTRSVRAASVVPSYNNWNSVGCYEDVVTARVLPHAQGVSGEMTVEKCLDACHTSGYTFAGLEWSQECFCGSALPPTPATDGRCNMSCQGNDDEICGGGLGLTVYQYGGSTPSPSSGPSDLASYNGYTYANCYVDSVANRVLPHQLGVSGGMTIEKCVDTCKGAGYAYAGLEYSHECFCGDTIPPEVATDGRCSMVCEGNENEICGGGNGLSVYTGTPLPPSNPSGPSNLATYKSWAYENCYVDSVTSRALPVGVAVSGPMTIEKCLDTCSASGYEYAGLEYAGECYCGTGISSQVATDGRCSMACAGNANELCGGGNGLSVYHSITAATPPGPIDSYNGYTYSNCYVDSVANRALPHQLGVSGGMTIEKCVDACKGAGYAYAGLEYSHECFCGDTKPAEVATDGRCAMVCEGNQQERCGGPNGLDVYEVSGSSSSTTSSEATSTSTSSSSETEETSTSTSSSSETEETSTSTSSSSETEETSTSTSSSSETEETSTSTSSSSETEETSTSTSSSSETEETSTSSSSSSETQTETSSSSESEVATETTVVTDYTTTTAVIGTFTTATTIATVFEGTGSYAETITKTTDVVVPATYTTTIVAPLTITTTAVIPYTTTTVVINGVTLTSTIATPVVGSTTVVVPIVGSTTQAVPLTGSTTVPIPLTGSTTNYFPVTTSTPATVPVTTTSLSAKTFAYTSSTISSYTVYDVVSNPGNVFTRGTTTVLTTVVKPITTTSTQAVPFTTSVATVKPLTLTASDIGYFTTTSSSIGAVPTTSIAINTFPTSSSNVAAVTATSTYYVPYTSSTTGYVPVETSSINVGSYTSSSVDIEPVVGSTTVVTEYTTTSVGYTPYTTTAYDTQVTTFVAAVPTPITVTTTFVTLATQPTDT